MTHQPDETTILQTVSPADNSIVVTQPLASQEDIIATLERANISQSHWRQTSLSQRKAYCTRAIDALLTHKEMIACEISWMMGRPIRYSSSELRGVEERARYMISICDEALEPITLNKKPGFTRYIKHEPLGTVFVIAPWNYPYLTAINSIIPALLAGNAVILKHSSQTPLCAERLQQAFDEAGLPKGVFQHLFLNHEDTEQLIASEQIQHVVFTGSVSGGRMVEKAAAGHFHNIGLELGGKDPAYIRADADLDHAVSTVVEGALFNGGQSCCGIERVYVDATIHDEFVSRAIQEIHAYQLGSPLEYETTLGPLVRTSAADFVREQIQQAIEMGATAHINESDFPASKPGTPYLAPQLLTDVTHQMRVMTEETFGPVVAIQKVHSDHEAVTLMNDSEFGLTASIFTRNTKQAVKLGEQLDVGTFFVNRCDYLDPALAWAGVKHSGRGCALSKLGFETLTRPKSFHIKHLQE
ncbi:aldehyde dehydrogenase family protein [Photobacterium sp. OFAV2-7]|uniref:aldehyde dehydrogenase family protein n=1 Tax=Photobacterium sp. OFAV2-7 TaxID=2917748 RepID=UPI001EF63259|nr:aldehyde dehydrogenase family protein [Photobacterium sp. OFAV2-7]MCG7586446.1 aldehyde dehydrogenase family protein [Photobacterium sp. OFAV2-7]